MTSFRQIEANRRNAHKSTGPSTEEGKRRSRCNAIRHGLTAETIIGALEDAEDYKAFEEAITADYNATSAVERELVLRLASLLWRLRRATTLETGLFEVQAEQLTEPGNHRQLQPISREVTYGLFRPGSEEQMSFGLPGTPTAFDDYGPGSGNSEATPNIGLARCYLRLSNLPNYMLDRLSRYEASLWRQVGQILLTLDVLDRRKPLERRQACASRAVAED